MLPTSRNLYAHGILCLHCGLIFLLSQASSGIAKCHVRPAWLWIVSLYACPAGGGLGPGGCFYVCNCHHNFFPETWLDLRWLEWFTSEVVECAMDLMWSFDACRIKGGAKWNQCWLHIHLLALQGICWLRSWTRHIRWFTRTCRALHVCYPAVPAGLGVARMYSKGMECAGL